MAGVKVDLTQVTQAFSELNQLTTSLEPVFLDMGEILLNNTRDRLTAGNDIHGQKFTPLKYLTVKRKKRNKDNVLIESGDLFRELTYQLVNGGKGLEFGSDRKYAAIHQFGSDAGSFNKPSGIPSRPFLGLTPKDETDILDIVADHLSLAFD
ncbi:MAG: phage virion morphogenesis protein [Gammaproteobacteria bacterium]|nr:phage virion morphogenesis protein [Gammaproteobacteria bacterium]